MTVQQEAEELIDEFYPCAYAGSAECAREKEAIRISINCAKKIQMNLNSIPASSNHWSEVILYLETKLKS